MADAGEPLRAGVLPSGDRPSPLLDPALIVRQFGARLHEHLRFYVYSDVVEELVFAAEYDEGRVTYHTALLTGGFGRDDTSPFVEISGFSSLSMIYDLEELYPTVRAAADEYLRDAPGDLIVGLFVSAAGSGARIDPEFARVHFSLFNVPFQPLVVYDPHERTISLSARGKSGHFENVAIHAVGKRRPDGRGGEEE